MVYWKIDEETIRCLINEDEIGKMGFDPERLKSGDRLALGEFLEALIDDSHNYIEWNTENGIQNFAARALPSAQYLITISCTFKDEAIDKDLAQIKRMIQALNLKIPEERLNNIENLYGSEKEQAFLKLSKDLHDVCTGKLVDEIEKLKKATLADKEEKQVEDQGVEQVEFTRTEKREEGEQELQSDPEEEKALPAQKITFHSLNEVIEFCSLLDSNMNYRSELYHYQDEYILLVDFESYDDKVNIITFMITAEEFGASCESQGYARYYLMEHGKHLIDQNAIQILKRFH